MKVYIDTVTQNACNTHAGAKIYVQPKRTLFTQTIALINPYTHVNKHMQIWARDRAHTLTHTHTHTPRC